MFLISGRADALAGLSPSPRQGVEQDPRFHICVARHAPECIKSADAHLAPIACRREFIYTLCEPEISSGMGEHRVVALAGRNQFRPRPLTL